MGEKLFERDIEKLREKGLDDEEIIAIFFSRLKKDRKEINTEKSADNSDITEIIHKRNIRAQATSFVDRMNVNKGRKGYKYLIDAIVIYKENNIKSLSNDLYPKIAEKYNTTSRRVYKAISTVIATSFKNLSDIEVKDLYGYEIPYGAEQPTNRTVIASIAELIK